MGMGMGVVPETVVEVTTEEWQGEGQPREHSMEVWIKTMSQMLCDIYRTTDSLPSI
jgi:hypothetical protein